MLNKKNLFKETKKEILHNLCTSKTFKIIQYAGIALISIYGLGYVFKVLAFTKNNYNKFKTTLKV
jgi:hypothetical protein